MGGGERRIWLNGQLVPWAEVTLHVLSQSAARGSLVFDVMPCYELADGVAILGLREHSERFLRSAALAGMHVPYDLEQILAAVGETVRANPGVQVVKLNAYYPEISLDVLPAEPAATLAIAAFALGDPGLPAVEFPSRPARLQVAEVRKIPSWVLSPQAKVAAGYFYTSVAKAQSRREGFDDVLLLDEHGDVAESSTQSFFLVDEGTLYTAPVDTVLSGITRRAVLELAADEGIPLKEGRVGAERMRSAAEAFLAGTTTNIWPVGQIDARTLPSPVPGALTARLVERFGRLIAGEDPELSPRWMQAV